MPVSFSKNTRVNKQLFSNIQAIEKRNFLFQFNISRICDNYHNKEIKQIKQINIFDFELVQF